MLDLKRQGSQKCPGNSAVIRQNELFHKIWNIEFLAKTDYLESNLNFWNEILRIRQKMADLDIS